MSIADAARATRTYFVNTHDCESWSVIHDTDPYFEQPAASEEEAQAACDILNLLAVLEAVLAMDRPVSREFKRAIEALIVEVREAGNDA